MAEKGENGYSRNNRKFLQVKRLPGTPWSMAYIRELLERGGYTRVIANGYEYTLTDEPVQTDEAIRLLHRR